MMISRKDLSRIELLSKLLSGYQDGKESFIDLPSKIHSLIKIMETVPEKIIEEIEQEWGRIKLVQAEASADRAKVLSGQFKDIFDDAVEKMKKCVDINELKKNYQCEEEDPLSWPYPEDVW